MKFVILKALNTASLVKSPCGNISNKQTQTPKAHQRLISSDERLFKTLIISGRFQNGRIIAAINDIL